MRAAIQIVLGILIMVLAYFVYESIMTPIRFNKLKDVREEAAIKRLIDIREAQKAYKDVNLRAIQTLQTAFKVPVGLSDHSREPAVPPISPA